MNEEEQLKIQSDLARCQGLLEGIYSGMAFEDFKISGVKEALNKAVDILQKTRDKLSIKTEPKY